MSKSRLTSRELHFVHEAVPSVTGRGQRLVLSVLGATSATATSPAALTILANGLGGTSVAGFIPSQLIPAQRAYASYEGSLTTPPRSADVTWVVFRNPIAISTADLNQFRARNGGNNARPLQAKAAAIVDFAASAIRAQGASVQPGAGMAYNTAYGGWLLRSAGSNFQVTFDLGAVPTTDISLVLLHATSSKWPNNGYSPINIDVNRTSLKANFDPARAHAGTGEDTRNYVWDRFTIPRLALVPGRNTIRFTLQSGAQTTYWIRNLRLDRGSL